ncbi:ras-related protein Rab-24 isoform X2 [Pelodiscus sinensis]|uniref:ras-related protein Rab-24 isoform X2 n=1 Tax=Pelodiscus sinensis TaxID=13735 RepID=UPI003F6B9B79
MRLGDAAPLPGRALASAWPRTHFRPCVWRTSGPELRPAPPRPPLSAMRGPRVDAKVVLLGQESAGKSSLVERSVHGRFRAGPCHNTIGAAFVAKALSAGGQTVTLGIWDTAGSERYEAMSRMYYRGARAAIVCYDLTDSSSFRRAQFWVNELQTFEENCRIYLCGTKSDLLEEDRRKRGVDFHDVQDYAEDIKAELFETSSKTGRSVGAGPVGSVGRQWSRAAVDSPLPACPRRAVSEGG